MLSSEVIPQIMKSLLSICLLLLPVQVLGEAPANGVEGLRLQIFLDQKCFGPGFLDGRPGDFTKKAAFAYNRSVGRAPGDWKGLMAEVKSEVETVYVTAVVPSFSKSYSEAAEDL